MKKETRKWCGFHKSPTHNRNESHAKKTPMPELKALEFDACSNSKP